MKVSSIKINLTIRFEFQDNSMRGITLYLGALRSFVISGDLQDFSRSANRMGESTSVINAQLKKFEEQVGVSLL